MRIPNVFYWGFFNFFWKEMILSDAANITEAQAELRALRALIDITRLSTEFNARVQAAKMFAGAQPIQQMRG